MSFSAFNARYHKEGLISVSSFNNYTNDKYICFEDDMIYDDMEKNFEVDMIFLSISEKHVLPLRRIFGCVKTIIK